MTRIRHSLGLAIVTTALVAVGCGSSSSGGGSGGSSGGGAGGSINLDSGTGACAPQPGLIDPTTCDKVANSATAIPFTPLTGTQPAPTGGTVLDGLYESTKTGVYGATTGNGRRITFVITTLADGTKHMLWNGEVRDATGANVTASLKTDVTVTIAGTQIANTTINCGATALLPPAFDYTVSGSDLILSLSSSMAATTYTRRGCAP